MLRKIFRLSFVTFLVGSLFVLLSSHTNSLASPRGAMCRADLAEDKLLYWRADGLLWLAGSGGGISDFNLEFDASFDTRRALGDTPFTFGGKATITMSGDMMTFDTVIKPELRLADDILRISPLEMQFYVDEIDDGDESYSTTSMFIRSLLGVRFALHDKSGALSATNKVLAFMDIYGGVRWPLFNDTKYPEVYEPCGYFNGVERQCPVVRPGDDSGVVPYFRIHTDITNTDSFAIEAYALWSQHFGSGNVERLNYVMSEVKLAFAIYSALAFEVAARGWTFFGEADGGFTLLFGLAGSSVLSACTE